MRSLIILLILTPWICFSQEARNAKKAYNNIYSYCINTIIDSLSAKEKQEFTLILNGKPAKYTEDWSLDLQSFNSEKEEVFNKRGNLKRKFKSLINKRLLIIYIKDLLLEDSRLVIPIFMVDVTYESRHKNNSDQFKNGVWLFKMVYLKETDSFHIEEIQQGFSL